MLRPTLLATAIAAACPAHAGTEIDTLRAELDALKTQYEARIEALEARVAAAEARAPDAAPAPSSGQPAESTANNRFNPDISLILQGRYARQRDTDRPVGGFISDGSVESPNRGFSVDGSEFVLSSNIDPYFRGYFNAVLEDESVGVEEAWVQTLALGHGVTLKGGRFRSAIGYQNQQHPHAWDFATNSLVYETLFGEGYAHDGLQVKWVAPTDLFAEFGAEIGRGAAFPGSDRNGNGVGSHALFGHVGGDVGASHSWRGGVSVVATRAASRSGTLLDLNDRAVDASFTGDSRTWIADFVWKWAPQGNATQTHFTFSAEWLRREESGSLNCEGGLCGGGSEGDYRTTQNGLYAQGVYQFMPRWRTGYRYDLLDPGTRRYGVNDSYLARPTDRPARHSLMVDYSPSEFSRLRLQYTRDASRAGEADNQWFVQYVHSLGSHGAHAF